MGVCPMIVIRKNWMLRVSCIVAIGFIIYQGNLGC